MNLTSTLAGLVVLAIIALPLQANSLPAPGNDTATLPEQTNKETLTSHGRDIKNNHFHERGRDKHNRAEELRKESGQLPNRQPNPTPTPR